MIYLFNSSEEVIKIVPSTAIKSFYQTQTLTSEKYISDRVDIELKALPEEILKQIEYVAIPDIQDKYRFHLFFVVREATEGNITEITGVQSGIEELRKSPVYDIRPQDRTVRFAAEQIIQGTNWTVGYAPDDVRVGNINVYYSSAFEGLKTLCEKTDVEMQFFVEINGNKVGNRYIEFKKRIGKNVGRRVVYGHNALQIVKEVEKTDLVTALVGRGRGEEVSSAEENAGGVTGYGRKITFEDIEWKKANGDPVDKPLGQKYVEIPEMTAIYGVQTPTGKRPKFGFIEFDTDDKAEVLRRTYEALLWVSRPKVELKTSSVYLKDTYIGDTVRVIRHDRGLAYETRVFEIKIDRISGRCEIKLGDKLSGNDGLSISKLSSQITNLENSLSQTVQNIVTNLPSADGFTRNWYTDQEPSDPRVGDTWFKPDPEYEGHTIMLTWNGEVWDEILRTYNDTRVADKLAEIDTQTQAMEAAIQENETKANQALEQAGASADLASEAQRLANETKQAHASLSQEVNEAKADLVQKGLELSQLTENFGVTERKVEELDGAIKETVTRADYDALTGRVSQAETTIESQAGEIRQRLTRTEVESAITSKGYQTKSQVDSNINGRGYITSSALTPYATAVSVENKVRETADGINRTITEVRGLIPTEIGGRNYILNSDRCTTTADTTLQASPDFVKSAGNSKVTISVEVEGTGITARTSGYSRYGVEMVIRHANGQMQYIGAWSNTTGDVSKTRISRTHLINGSDFAVVNIGIWVQIDGNVKVCRPKLEISSLPTDWTPAPEDLTLPFENFKNEYDRTAKSVIDNLSTVIQTDSQWYTTINNRLRTAEGNFDTLSRTKADLTAFQTVKATTDLYERILGKTEGDIQTNASRLVMSSDLFQVEVGKYINLANNLVYGATKLPKYISSVATTNHIRRVSWEDHDGVGIKYTSEMSGWLGVIFPLTKRFVKQGERLSYRIEISVDTVPSDGGVLIQLIDNTPRSNIMYNSTILISKTGNMVATGYIDIPRTGELAEYSLRFTLTGPGNIIMHKMIIVEGNSIPENFYDTTDYNSEYTRTNLTMLQDRISLGLFNQAGLVSGAHFGQNGVYIKGSLINLDGTVNINDAFVKKLLVDTASIQTLTAFSARIANLVAVNIDASKITTNMITAIEGAFRSSTGSVSISRNTISINTGSGTNMILNGSGLHYNDSANNLIGWVGRSDQRGSVYGTTLNISVAPGKLLALGYAAGVGGTYRSAMIIDGRTGKVSIPNGLFPSVTSSAGIYVANSSDAVWLVRTDRASGIVFYNDGRVGIIKNNTIVQNF